MIALARMFLYLGHAAWYAVQGLAAPRSDWGEACVAGTDRPAKQLAADARSNINTICPSLQPGYSLPYHRPGDLEGHRRRGVLGLSLAALLKLGSRVGQPCRALCPCSGVQPLHWTPSNHAPSILCCVLACERRLTSSSAAWAPVAPSAAPASI